jgi:branched-chain amino acid transport system substrate-binding protein
VLDTEGILQVALSVHPTIAQQSDYTIRPYYGFDDEVRVIADYLSEQGHERIAVLWVQVPECEAAIEGVLIPEIKGSGASLVASEPYEFGASSVRQQLTKINGANPDAVITMDFGNMMGVMLKEAQTLQMKDKLIGGIGLFYAPPIEPELLNGLLFAGPSFVIRGSKKYTEFADSFETESGERPSYDVLYTYDAFKLLIEALGEGGRAPAELIESIIDMKEYEGVSGTMEIHPDGNISVDVIMGVYSEGKMTPLQN